MGLESRNPAIFTGLLGAAAWVNPTPALALSLGTAMSGGGSSSIQFALGCVTGAALSTAINIAFASMGRSREERAYEREMERAAHEAAASRAGEGPGAQAAVPEADGAAPSPQRPLAASRKTARHMAAREWEASGVIRVQEPAKATVTKPKVATAPAAAPAGPAAAAEPSVAGSPGWEGAAPSHMANDYGEIAEKYVRRRTLRERMSSRASGVASVLKIRLGADPLDGLPVIERADGTVGDVGTGWWNRALGESVGATGTPMAGPAKHAAPSAGPSVNAGQPEVGTARSSYISKSVAEVNVGVYPEHRSGDDLDHKDDWDRALEAMDERVPQDSPVFMDYVGGIDTIDEPDSLWGSAGTAAPPMHEGYPALSDTGDLALPSRDDSASSRPAHARRSPREFLTVIEGGSQRMSPLSPTGDLTSYRPKHFAAKRAGSGLDAKEA